MELSLTFIIGLTIGLSLYLSIRTYLSLRRFRKDLEKLSNALSATSASLYSLALKVEDQRRDIEKTQSKQVLKG